MNNILLDRLPEAIEVGGEEYDIRTDFRISIMFELLMEDPEVSDDDKLPLALDLYYPEMPPDIEKAVEGMLWFYKCGRQTNSYEKQMAERAAAKKRIYSFDYDDDYIFAAFLHQYRMDLNKIGHLHWWKFRAMFKSLTEDNEFVKIMGYRSVDLNDGMSKSQKDFYRKMKRIHEIPLSKSEADRQDAITEALMNGKDLTGLL